MSLNKISYYYKLTKPGIVRGNSIAVIAGFLLASQGNISWDKLVFVLIGSALIMSGGCVLNNFIDRDIDKKMTRTKKRALASKAISPKIALIYGGGLATLGFLCLYFFVNSLTTYVGMFGFVVYVYIYAYFKRRTEHGTLVGSISGAVPPLAGYVAVTDRIDIGAIVIFLILAFWQLPHFYAITIFRAEEYAKAKLPVLSLTRGIGVTKRYVVTYIVLFILISLLPYRYGLVGRPYMIIMIFAGIYWLYVAVFNYKILNDIRWARKVFGTSLLVLMIFTVAIFLDTVVL